MPEPFELKVRRQVERLQSQDYPAIEAEVTHKRLAWLAQNRPNQKGQSPVSPRQAYRLLFFDYLGSPPATSRSWKRPIARSPGCHRILARPCRPACVLGSIPEKFAVQPTKSPPRLFCRTSTRSSALCAVTRKSGPTPRTAGNPSCGSISIPPRLRRLDRGDRAPGQSQDSGRSAPDRREIACQDRGHRRRA
jgi:hypothetical protein